MSESEPDIPASAAPSEPSPELVAYQVSAETMPLRVAPRQRDWMERTPDRYAYRCLPLVIANQQGWELLSPVDFEAEWDGGDDKTSIRLRFDGAASALVQTHFGSGILTFATGYLFRTSPGYNLWCKGPANAPKDAIAPLEGVIETDWAPYPFTMNWKFTRARQVIGFERGEPIASVVPMPRGDLARFRASVRPIGLAPELERQYSAWRESRSRFISDLDDPESQARAQQWQRAYMLGRDADGTEFPEHESKLNLRGFTPWPPPRC